MEEKEISPAESLTIINNMINTAKHKIADDGFHIIFWGWLITLCALTHYLTLKLGYDWGGVVWTIFPPLGAVVSTIYGYREGRAKKVKTYVDSHLGYLWGGFAVCLFITLIFMGHYGLKATYFSLMQLYGIATFVTGGLLNFRPLIFGSFFSFAFAILSVFVSESDLLLCLSGALVCSYIIPGHMLRSKFKSERV